ncbi:serine/threonine protein kinase [Pseudenhygromyxa sp. WMMC2535]|uniref:serine/threonine protein kinase n=1 Tax=Pseudenhygromyxa sp. WMMC2535 TaxID=2712867 RepID=UPI001553BAC9|nr:serine/threonine-protein kinase [Pseudenhygromyxa sp. WMMC2535]NVB42068.1 serine/threonine protein kinase [Pseudenhygromyxa sp. WMMC2535]
MRRLGDYELLRKIGSGGMAEVWMGRRAAMGGASKAVAIKLLARNVLDDPAYREMFLEEARLSMLLTNSNVVQVFDVGENDGEIYMVMEWIDGLNLSELRRKMLAGEDRLDAEVSAHIIGEVLRALAYAHGLHHDGSQSTIVHRDVSPQNVLLSVSGEVKLADFGVARLAREETSGMHVKGKLRYMAPEQLKGRSREPTVDIYAVGAMLHELLLGEKFRNTRDESDLYSMVLSGEYKPLPPDTPAPLAELCHRLLEPDPKQRIASAEEALEVLHRWQGFRNSSIELARLVRRWVGVEAPRSGILTSAMMAEAEARGRARQQAATADTASVALAGSTKGIAGSAQTATLASSPSEGSARTDRLEPTEVDEPSRDSQPSRAPTGGHAVETRTWAASVEQDPGKVTRWMALMAVAVFMAMGFGVLGLGFGMGWWGNGGDDVVAGGEGGSDDLEGVDDAAVGHALSETSSPADLGGPATDSQVAIVPSSELEGDSTGTSGTGDPSSELEGDSTGTSDTGESSDGETADEDEDEDENEDESGTETTEKKTQVDRTPSEITFLTGDYMFVYVKIAGKQLSLEPSASISLRPGSYRVQFREIDGEWKNAKKRLKIKAGREYRVRMSKGGGFGVQEVH